MRIAIIVGIVLALAFGTQRADACGSGGGAGIGGGGVLVLGAYAGVTIGMAAKDVTGERPSMGYGIAETLIHAPIAVAWTIGAAHEAEYTSWSSSYTVMASIHGALALHGIYTIVKRAVASDPEHPAKPAPMFKVGGVSANLTPAPIQNGAGLGLSGAF